jgi:DNA-binding transcriptional LysR family regulator
VTPPLWKEQVSCARPGSPPHLAAHPPARTTRETSTGLPTPVCSRRAAARTALATVAAAALIVLGTAAPALAADSIPTVISNLQNWLIGILAGLATLFLVIGGVRYVISGGNPGEVEKAKTAFRSAGFGYCLAILAPVVITILKSIVGG